MSRLKGLHLKISPTRLLLSLALGALTLALINSVPAVEHSFVGAPDRAMQDTAFWLRADDFAGEADPVLFVDIDDDTMGLQPYRTTAPGYVPSVYVSRTLLADLLKFVLDTPAAQAPKAVILDADIGGPAPDPAGPEKLKAVLAAWAANPKAPPLFLARETFEPAPLGEEGALRVPRTLYDDVVAGARNIHWGSPKVLFDADGVVQEVSPYECVLGADGKVHPLFSVTVQAYQAMNGGKLPAGSPTESAVAGAQAYCDTKIPGYGGALETPRRPAFGLTVNYHLSMRAPEQGRAWPRLHADWDGRAPCGETTTQSAILRQVSATVMAEAGEDASRDILCQRLVIIGGTNQIANDVAATPTGPMPGAIVLTNATRGLQMTDGGLRPAHWSIQLAVLVVVTLAMFMANAVVEQIREHYQRRRREDLWSRVKMLPLNPVIFNGVMWSISYAIGVVLLLWSMSLGYWGFLSGPAMGSAIGNLLGDFLDEEQG